MKKWLRNSLSILLSAILMFSLFTALPFSVSAAEIDTEQIGAKDNSEKIGYTAHTQSEAVQWAWNQEGNYYDSNYGYQCVNLVRAYYGYLGVPLPSGNANTYLNDSSNHKPAGWTINWGTNGMQPGDIMVFNGGSYGHVAIVLEMCSGYCKIMQQNGDNRGEYRTEGSKCHYGTRYYSNISGYIHPDFATINPPTNAWISPSSNLMPTYGSISFTFGAEGATNYWMVIDHDGNCVVSEEAWSGVSYSFADPGEYIAYVVAYNSAGRIESGRVYFNVRPQGHTMTDAEGAGQTIPDGDYWICSKIAPDYFVDIPGTDYNTQNGTNLEMCRGFVGAETNTKYDVFTFKYLNNGYYKITQMTTSIAVDVTGGSLYRETNVQMYKYNGTDAQQWSVEKTDAGYKLRSKCNNYYLDVYGGKHESGTNLHVWSANETSSQYFGLIPYAPDERPIKDGIYTIKSSVGDTCYLDVSGVPGEYKNDSNIQIWNYDDPEEKYKFEYVGDGYYRIYEATSNLPVEIINDNVSYLDKNRNAKLYSKNDSRGQFWKIKKNSDGTYFFINKLSGYYLDVCDGSTANGTNVHIHPYNGTKAQRWLPRRVLSDDMVTVNDMVTNSDATSVSPSVTVKVDGSVINSKFYSVKTEADIANGTGTVTVTGKDTYCGSVTKSFNITINDTTVINDFVGNKYNTEKGDIITYYLNLSPPNAINYLNGTIYYNKEVLSPIMSYYTEFNAPSFDHANFRLRTPGEVEFDLYNDNPKICKNNSTIVKMQFRVIKKGGESWLGNDFSTDGYDWNSLIAYGMEPHILTNQKIYSPVGDANNDGKIDVLDATIVQKHATGKADLTDEQLAVADVNNDNNVDILDAAEIQKFAAGIITEFKKKA